MGARRSLSYRIRFPFSVTRTSTGANKPAVCRGVDKEFGIGRPYLDKDPAHLAPIDGKEYIDHHRQVPRQSVAMVKKKAHIGDESAWA